MNISKRPLTFRLIVYLFILSAIFISGLSLFEYNLSLKTNLKKIDNSFRIFNESSLESIVVSLYYVDYNLLEIQLSGLLKLDFIEYVEVVEDTGSGVQDISVGEMGNYDYKTHTAKLIHYDSLGNSYYLGDITLYGNITKVKNRVIVDTFRGMIPKFFLVLIISITLFIMFQFIMIRHFSTIIRYTEDLDYSERGVDLELDRKSNRFTKSDELSQVVNAINRMRHKIYSDFKTISEIEDELHRLNVSLQNKVNRQNSELEEAIDTLRLTQDKLVESEKLASLRGLIAGITHEINNPVGISVTGVSFLNELSKDIMVKYSRNKIKKSELESYLKQVLELTSSISNNLNRASDLVGNLKKLSSDQTSGEHREFNLAEYIDEILVTLRIKLKRTKHSIEVHCPSDLFLDSIPGAFGQILTNLVLNSLLHGFEDIDSGTISIDIINLEESIEMIYRDNGVGISENIIEKVFDPFFTTKKGQGGTGLGLQIINNIVTDTLGGTLTLNSKEGEGVEFKMVVPKKSPQV